MGLSSFTDTVFPNNSPRPMRDGTVSLSSFSEFLSAGMDGDYAILNVDIPYHRHKWDIGIKCLISMKQPWIFFPIALLYNRCHQNFFPYIFHRLKFGKIMTHISSISSCILPIACISKMSHIWPSLSHIITMHSFSLVRVNAIKMKCLWEILWFLTLVPLPFAYV